MLTNDTIRHGMYVRVVSPPLEGEHPFDGETGRVVGILGPPAPGYSAAVAVQFRDREGEVRWFAPRLLVPHPKET